MDGKVKRRTAHVQALTSTCLALPKPHGEGMTSMKRPPHNLRSGLEPTPILKRNIRRFLDAHRGRFSAKMPPMLVLRATFHCEESCLAPSSLATFDSTQGAPRLNTARQLTCSQCGFAGWPLRLLYPVQEPKPMSRALIAWPHCRDQPGASGQAI